jgi:hypothetical protein
MKTIRRFNKFSDAHPLLSICIGLLVIVLVGLVLLPANPPDLGAVSAAHSKGAV